MTPEPGLPPAIRPRRRPWRRIVVGLCLGGLAITALATLPLLYNNLVAGHDLEEAIAEVDRAEPRGWHLEDIEAARTAIPDDKNAALVVLGAAPLLPAKLPDDPIYEENADLPPPVQLNGAQAAALRRDLVPLNRARDQARRLVDYLHGRYPVRWSDDFFGTLIPHVQKVREVMWLLDNDASIRLQEGDAEGAWLSARAVLHAARSLGDEPLAITQLVRVAGRSISVRALERVLAQAAVSENGLAKAQGLVEEEAREPLLLVALRGERAGCHRLFSNLEDGTVDIEALSGGRARKPASHWGPFSRFAAGPLLKESHAWMLRYMTEAVSIAKRPGDDQAQALRQHEATLADGPEFARLFIAALAKVAVAIQRSNSELRCAAAGLAVERYRLRNGRWPKALEALVADGLLKAVPVDPYDGRPLRLRATRDGVVVYSVGETRTYKGDALDRQDWDPTEPRLEFRLWDPGRRRQSPLPPPPKDPDPDEPAPEVP